MATAIAPRQDARVKETLFVWEGVDRNNKPMRGEMRGASETVVTTNLRRQGIRVQKIKRQTSFIAFATSRPRSAIDDIVRPSIIVSIGVTTRLRSPCNELLPNPVSPACTNAKIRKVRKA